MSRTRTALLILALFLAWGGHARAQDCVDETCCPAGYETIAGGPAGERLKGTRGADCIAGNGGNDHMSGGRGNDVLIGSSGSDKLAGGAGNDFLIGGAGDDLLSGGGGNDVLDGGRGNDRLFGGGGQDQLLGGSGDDSLNGGRGDDYLEGGPGNDVLVGGAGNDILYGGGGIDQMFGGSGDDTFRITSVCEIGRGEIINGGSGYDRLETAVSRGVLEAAGVVLRSIEEIVEVPATNESSCELVCPPGMHPVHRTLAGLQNDLEEKLDHSQYECIASETCSASLCGDHGACDDSDGTPACACDPGYAGSVCDECAPGYERDVAGACVLGPECRNSVCSGRGDCFDLDGEVACSCDEGIAGAACTECAVGFHGRGRDCVPDEECRPTTCSGNGTCDDSSGAAVCTCDDGFYGPDCSETEEPAPCDPAVCSDRGTCEQGPLAPRCICDRGWAGADCSEYNPPTAMLIRGGTESLTPGETAVLTVELTGIGNFDDEVVWTLVSGGGTLVPNGHSAEYTPPSGLTGIEEAEIDVSPPYEEPRFNTTIKTNADALPIPITQGGGEHDARFTGLDRAIADFMIARCVGAASVAVQRHGVEVYRAGYGRTEGAPNNDPNWIHRCGSDPFVPSAQKVHPSMPILVGSNNKVITAAIAREAARRRWVQAKGFQPNDEQIDNMRICDPDFDLLPSALSNVVCAGAMLPTSLWTDLPGSPLESCEDNPCLNGGTCLTKLVTIGKMLKEKSVCECPAPFSGNRCEKCQKSPVHADSRWHDITLGHLFRHSDGIYGRIDHDKKMVPALNDLRGYTTAAAVQASQSELAWMPNLDEGIENLKKERSWLKWSYDSYFVPDLTALEALVAGTASCMLFDPGTQYRYSNYSFSLQQIIGSHVYGAEFSALPARPDTHAGSVLEQFLAEHLGITKGAKSPEGVRSFLRAEPYEPIRYRRYQKNDGLYYRLAKDSKLIDCAWSPFFHRCEFVFWQELNRFALPLETTTATLIRDDVVEGGHHPGAGSLSVELPLWLKVMRKYWVGTDGSITSDKAYGVLRGNDWTTPRGHTGHLPHATSIQIQNVSTKPKYQTPPLLPSGRLAPDTLLSDLVDRTCTLPSGIDFIISLAQKDSDPVCAAEEEWQKKACADWYLKAMDYVIHGLCAANWSKIDLTPKQFALP